MVTAWETEAAETLQERLAQLRANISKAQKQPTVHTPGKSDGIPTSGSWKPNQSGNPDGRPPKALCVTSIAKELLDQPADLPDDAPDFMKDWRWVDLIAYNWIIKTAKIDAPILKEFLDRTEGKVITPIEASGRGGTPLFDGVAILEKLKAVAEAGSNGAKE